MNNALFRKSMVTSSAGSEARGPVKSRASTILRPLAFVAAMGALLCVGLVRPAAAQLTVVYSNNFESYTTGSYPFPTNPLSGWNATPSQGGLVPAIVSPPVNATGNALNMNGYGGGAAAWMTAASPLLAGSASDWSATGSARFLSTNYNPVPPQPWYGSGGLLLSSTGDMSGDFLWLGIESGWGEVNATTTWARPWANWSLGGVTGGGTLFPPGGAIRMSTDTWGPAILTASRTGGSSSIVYTLDSPVDAQRVATLAFTGAQAAALDNLQYVGFANYLSVWQYDNLTVSAVPEPSSMALLGMAVAGLGWPFFLRCGAALSVTEGRRRLRRM